MHKSIEMLIGRLVTDEAFRAEFRRDPRGTLAGAAGRDLVLTPDETEALLATDATLWDRVAAHVDPRLQKAALRDGLEDSPPPSQLDR